MYPSVDATLCKVVQGVQVKERTITITTDSRSFANQPVRSAAASPDRQLRVVRCGLDALGLRLKTRFLPFVE